VSRPSALRRLRGLVKAVILLGLLAVGGLLLWGYARNHPEDMPWTALDLTRPVGAFTGRKLTALVDEGERCHALMEQAGIAFDILPPLRASDQCGYDEAVRLRPGGALEMTWRPAGLGTRCAVAASLALWEWHVVQPAALAAFGQEVRSVEHFGSYSCRRLYGRDEGAWSEHAGANAVDIAGFILADGSRVSVLRDWDDEGPRGRFLREVRDGACRLFATVLSPDYNRAHADHFHFDHAQRGAYGWRGCR
jgi:hypothetical protein